MSPDFRQDKSHLALGPRGPSLGDGHGEVMLSKKRRRSKSSSEGSIVASANTCHAHLGEMNLVMGWTINTKTHPPSSVCEGWQFFGELLLCFQNPLSLHLRVEKMTLDKKWKQNCTCSLTPVGTSGMKTTISPTKKKTRCSYTTMKTN